MRKKPFRGYCAAGCGNPVFARSKRAKYCSVQCALARYGDRKPCPACGAVVRTKKKIYCSLQCHHDYWFKQRCELLESGTYPVTMYSNFIKKYLLKRLGAKCSKCGWAERHPVTGKVPVEVEHIDGNWQNNTLENLTLLCPNCHSLTPTYRALNRGRGRAERLGGRARPLSKKDELRHVNK